MKWLQRNTQHKRRNIEIAPDEIFLDSSNVLKLDTDQLEGRMERPLGRRSFLFLGIFFVVLFTTYLGQSAKLQIVNGEAYAERAENNQLVRDTLFADRGEIRDRTGRILAFNVRGEDDDFSVRTYAPWRGVATILGYAKPPAKDGNGFYFRTYSEGVSGIESVYNSALAGVNGAKLTETDVFGELVSESTILPPSHGKTLTLSIDAMLSQALYDAVASRASSSKFQGGSGVIMDVHTGELLSIVSYPEYPLQTMADGTDSAAIAKLLSDPGLPFLDRATSGLYAPGSIVKPYVAVGALTEGVIDEHTRILSTGSISVPNPYDPSRPSIFKDWKAHGWVNVREAIAHSSDVYFYEVGGGFEDQPGLGIDRLDRYLRLFGFGGPAGLEGFSEGIGVIPTPEWKEVVFPGDPWRVGDTYNTAIGQYGVQVTPLQAVRAVAAVANNGTLLTPTLIASSTGDSQRLPIASDILQTVHEGMRLAVTEGTAASINFSFVKSAAKTGTAQLGSRNQFMNSWITVFYPYDNPHYALAIVLEKAPAGTLYGAPAAAADFFSWVHDNAPEYLE